jgi:hypothetical protein
MALQLNAKDCSINQPLASLLWEGSNMYRRLTGEWSTQANASGILPRVEWHWGVDSSAINYPLGHQAERHCIYAIPLWGLCR